jgi:type I restriction enzyme, R subunit
MKFTEDSLIEQHAIALFAELGWETANCYHGSFGSQGDLGRETNSEVVLLSRLLAVMQRINPGLPTEALQIAIDELIPRSQS